MTENGIEARLAALEKWIGGAPCLDHSQKLAVMEYQMIEMKSTHDIEQAKLDKAKERYDQTVGDIYDTMHSLDKGIASNRNELRMIAILAGCLWAVAQIAIKIYLGA